MKQRIKFLPLNYRVKKIIQNDHLVSPWTFLIHLTIKSRNFYECTHITFKISHILIKKPIDLQNNPSNYLVKVFRNRDFFHRFFEYTKLKKSKMEDKV